MSNKLQLLLVLDRHKSSSAFTYHIWFTQVSSFESFSDCLSSIHCFCTWTNYDFYLLFMLFKMEIYWNQRFPNFLWLRIIWKSWRKRCTPLRWYILFNLTNDVCLLMWIQGVFCVSMDTVNILGKNWKKINIYHYYPVKKGQAMVGNYFNVFRLVG